MSFPKEDIVEGTIGMIRGVLYKVGDIRGDTCELLEWDKAEGHWVIGNLSYRLVQFEQPEWQIIVSNKLTHRECAECNQDKPIPPGEYLCAECTPVPLITSRLVATNETDLCIVNLSANNETLTLKASDYTLIIQRDDLPERSIVALAQFLSLDN